jgi:nitric oxide dioxygenase
MLSESSRSIIDATLPAVAENIDRITEVFYPLMFERYPEVRAYFNQAHQAQGSQRRALANAVVAYASNLDRLEALGDAVALIVHKHASLNIQPQHYPIVGECLLAAVREVLGEAASDEVLAAWGEAYQQLADLLIEAEETVYRENAHKKGGWRGEREFRLVKKVRESEVITSFHLVPADGGALPDFTPGQYTTLILSIDGQTVRRNYSLSSRPGEPFLRVSIKREPGGLVSNYLHDQLREGDSLRLTPPCGHFTLRDNGKPIVMLSGGVGLTPLMSMLPVALEQSREVHFLHGSLNSRTHAFRADIEAYRGQYPGLRVHYCYSAPLPEDRGIANGFFDRARLAHLLPEGDNFEVYLLGPRPFMQLAYRSLLELGVTRERIHFEFFGPLEDLEPTEEVVAAA